MTMMKKMVMIEVKKQINRKLNIMKTKKRGQAAVTDLFIAISIFIILVTITTLTWNLYNIRLQNRFDYDDMMIKGFQVTDSLIKSRGIPPDWETQKPTVSNIQLIGLSDNERFLLEEKVKAFADENILKDTVIKDTLKINLYEYYFVLRHINGTKIFTRGKFPAGNFAVNLARLVIYQKEPSVLEFAIWK